MTDLSHSCSKKQIDSTGLFMHAIDHRLFNHTNQIADLRREIAALEEETLKLKTLEWHHVTEHTIMVEPSAPAHAARWPKRNPVGQRKVLKEQK